ncbi:hypothetical protein F1880_006650 [Penicillium rolfsii]|nr:hypothetical protein F1880_006650 [Penicillium rolfsii]
MVAYLLPSSKEVQVSPIHEVSPVVKNPKHATAIGPPQKLNQSPKLLPFDSGVVPRSKVSWHSLGLDKIVSFTSTEYI